MPEAESIAITDYDPTWPLQFEVLRRRLASALQDRALSIEHVGSTAVPGLTAKPIIDLNVAIASPTDLPAAIAALAPGEPRHHLYLCAIGSDVLRQLLAFRDYLRANPDVAAEYATLKRRLAREHWNDREAYTRGKTQFIEEVLRRAGVGSLSPFSAAR